MAQPLYFVRHGESEWNAQSRIQGQTVHPGLTALGRQQARQAAAAIGADLTALGLPLGEIVTSDLARAAQTADIIAVELGGDVRSDAQLREQHMGPMQGLTRAEAADLIGLDWDGDGGESTRQLRERMAVAVDGLDRSRVMIVVSHRRAIRQALAHIMQLETAEQITVDNGAVTRVHEDRLTSVTTLS